MRSISTTSSVTVQSLPFLATPVTASIGRAIRSAACSSALTTTSRADEVPFRPLERRPEEEPDDLLEDEPDDLFEDDPDDRLLVPFAFESATLDHLVVVEFVPGEASLGLLGGALARDREALEQVALPMFLLRLGDQSVLPLELELHELALDVVLVVELPIG